MREEIIKVYKFEELSPEAKERAISKWREDGLAFDDCDASMLTEQFEEKLVEFGFYAGVNVEWSLSCCQGDGVAFYGGLNYDVWIESNRDKFTEEEMRRLNWLNGYHGIELETTKNSFGHHYSHWNTMNVEVTCDYDAVDYYVKGYELLEAVLGKLATEVKTTIQDLSQKLEREGYDVIDYQQSDECITEFFENNPYEFLEDGTRY